MSQKTKIDLLIDKGVTIPNPSAIFIADDIDPERISGERVTLHSGTKLMGKDTLIMSDTVLGFESPVTLDNVFVGKGTRLNGGFFQNCVFAGNNTFGSGAHVRGGTILEEGSNAAHTVGLKQTILFPFVTLGSLINFCDCMMAGGTSRKDHSEVGSSFIHFNYTPNQDKATPSMFGNVYEGVMLKSRPIFLGGQGGVVGPCRLPFGSVTAAGTIWRKDIIEPDRLLFGGAIREAVLAKKVGVYSNIGRVFKNNILYIAALVSLMSWYLYIRPHFVNGSSSQNLLIGMQNTLKTAIDERINRLDDFVKRLYTSREILLSGNREKVTPVVQEHDAVIKEWNNFFYIDRDRTLKIFLDRLKEKSNLPPEQFIYAIDKGIAAHGKDYISVIKALDNSDAKLGSRWLQTIENSISLLNNNLQD